MIPVTNEDVVAKVQQLLNDNATPDLTLRVMQNGIREEGDWIYIPVVPNPVPARRFAFYETLAIVEQKMQTEMKRTVLLVPVSPDTAQEAESTARTAARSDEALTPA